MPESFPWRRIAPYISLPRYRTYPLLCSIKKNRHGCNCHVKIENPVPSSATSRNIKPSLGTQ